MGGTSKCGLREMKVTAFQNKEAPSENRTDFKLLAQEAATNGVQPKVWSPSEK